MGRLFFFLQENLTFTRVNVCEFWCALWEQFSDQQRYVMKIGKNVMSKGATTTTTPLLQCHFVTFYYK